jgi:transglutaminase-like putative cysteine protease
MLRRIPCRSRAAVLAVLAFAGVGPAQAQPTEKPTPKSRTFELTYRATIKDLPAGKVAKVWVPVPSTSDDQDVELLSTSITSKRAFPKTSTGKEPRYGNQVWYGEVEPAAGGKVELTFKYRVTRREVKGQTGIKYKDDAARIKRFLEADSLVPIKGKPLGLIKDKKLPADKMKTARVLYDVVNDHMKYSKDGTGWGRGDSVWACDSKTGNCSDFHSLFISLSRSQKIPAKFEMGLPLPEKRGEGTIGGYHCWAFFKPEGKEWVPVDISEANKDPKMKDYYFGNLTADRVTLTTGRDFDLVPRQKGKALNFMVHPYAEVDGKPVANDKVKPNNAYEDVK